VVAAVARGAVEAQQVLEAQPHRVVVLLEIRVVLAHHPQAALVALKETTPPPTPEAALEGLVEDAGLLVLLDRLAVLILVRAPAQMLNRAVPVALLETILSAIRL
jgi:hypothetical protein